MEFDIGEQVSIIRIHDEFHREFLEVTKGALVIACGNIERLLYLINQASKFLRVARE